MHDDGYTSFYRNCGFVSQTDQLEFNFPPDRTLIDYRA
jgi:hypothetical protein